MELVGLGGHPRKGTVGTGVGDGLELTLIKGDFGTRVTLIIGTKRTLGIGAKRTLRSEPRPAGAGKGDGAAAGTEVGRVLGELLLFWCALASVVHL